MSTPIFQDRLKKASAIVRTLDIDVLVVDNLIDVLYLTGLQMSAGRLLVTKKSCWLVVDSRYIEAAKKSAPCEVILGQPDTLGKPLPKNTEKVGFDSTTTSFDAAANLKKLIKPAKFIAVRAPFQELRSIKDAGEIEKMQAAATLGSEGLEYVIANLKTGVTEAELAKKLEIFWLTKGADGLSFDPIIAFGANSALPHYRAGKEKLKKGMTVLIDIGVKLNGYCSDMTRTVFFGPPSKTMKEVYETVLAAQLGALEHCKPGVCVCELDRIARKIITERGFGDKFTHSLGHSIGIEVHEYPRVRDHASLSKVLLQPGLYITIEPGVYLPGIGGVRIEDTILITKDGYKNLQTPTKELRIV